MMAKKKTKKKTTRGNRKPGGSVPLEMKEVDTEKVEWAPRGGRGKSEEILKFLTAVKGLRKGKTLMVPVPSDRTVKDTAQMLFARLNNNDLKGQYSVRRTADGKAVGVTKK